MAWLVLLVVGSCKSDTDDSSVGDDDDDVISGDPGDALVHLARSQTSTFWETTDVEAVDGFVYTCTGVKSLVVHDATNPEAIWPMDTIFFEGNDWRYPRCSHLDLDAANDRLLVASHVDEVQTQAWLAFVDIEQRDTLEVVDEVVLPDDELIEEAVFVGDAVFVAATDAGVFRYELDGKRFGARTEQEGLGTVLRVANVDGEVAAGTNEGQVHFLDDGLEVRATVEVGGSVQHLLNLGDGRLAVAMGSSGLVLVDVASAEVLSVTDTNGTAVRLDRMASGELLVANWADVRLYDVSGDVPEVRAVDAVFEADPRPRHLAAAADGDLVFAGEWSGLHTLRFHDDRVGAEFTPSTLQIAVSDDGSPADVTLTVTNEGQERLTLDDVTLPPGWTADPASAELAPAEQLDVRLSFAGSTDISTASAVFATNDPDESEAVVELRVGSNRIFVGDEAPDFTYEGINTGETHTLSEERGNVVLLAYFATF